eukprot:Skav232392  [mRNA]  locus=scaffold1077:458354:463892:- [translate_table: standard]
MGVGPSVNLTVPPGGQTFVLMSPSECLVSVEYRTAWTGVCKPRGARTARVIALVPQGSANVWGGASVAVTVPPGVTAGQQLQVQTPAGWARWVRVQILG